MEGSGVEGGRMEGRDGKEREGNNVLPHLKRAVAVYVYMTADTLKCSMSKSKRARSQ